MPGSDIHCFRRISVAVLSRGNGVLTRLDVHGLTKNGRRSVALAIDEHVRVINVDIDLQLSNVTLRFAQRFMRQFSRRLTRVVGSETGQKMPRRLNVITGEKLGSAEVLGHVRGWTQAVNFQKESPSGLVVFCRKCGEGLFELLLRDDLVRTG